MKLLLVINGESFRSGPQMSRIRGTNNYFERQMLACSSHLDFINKIKNKFNIDTDVLIISYKLNDYDDNRLIKYYQDNNINVINSVFLDNVSPNEIYFLKIVYNKINEYLEKYDNCMMLRIDLYLKKYFIDNVLFDEKIRFPHIDCNLSIEHANKTGEFFVCHTIIQFPKKYFYIIKNKIIYEYSTCYFYNNLISNNIPISDIEFYINTLHTLTTDSCSNPIYCQIGRKYFKSCQYEGYCGHYYLYDKTTNKFIYDKDNVILKWKEYENNQYEDELLNKICN